LECKAGAIKGGKGQIFEPGEGNTRVTRLTTSYRKRRSEKKKTQGKKERTPSEDRTKGKLQEKNLKTKTLPIALPST